MPYRDDRDALRTRRDELAKDLADLSQRTAALEALVQSRAEVERELADVEERLARAEVKTRSALDGVRVASPCNAPWEAMVGDDRARFCEQCQKNVYNLSAMTRDEAELLILEKEGNLCVRFYQRTDGTMLTADCPVGVRKKRVRRLAIVMTGVGAAAALAGAASLTMVQGDMARPPQMKALEPDPVELVPDPEPPPAQKEKQHPVMGKLSVDHFNHK
jgi:hypothetical protein